MIADVRQWFMELDGLSAGRFMAGSGRAGSRGRRTGHLRMNYIVKTKAGQDGQGYVAVRKRAGPDSFFGEHWVYSYARSV